MNSMVIGETDHHTAEHDPATYAAFAASFRRFRLSRFSTTKGADRH